MYLYVNMSGFEKKKSEKNRVMNLEGEEMFHMKGYQEALHWMFGTQKLELDSGESRRAIRDVLSMEGVEELRDWQEIMTMISEPLGIGLLSIYMSIEDLCQSHHMFPLLTKLSINNEELWIGVRERKRGKFLVSLIGVNQKDCWMSRAELAQLLGEDPSSATNWLTMELLAPFTAKKESTVDTTPDKSSGSNHWKLLRTILRFENRELWTIVVYAVFIGAMTLLTPITVQALVNTVSFGNLLQPLLVLSLLFVVGLVFLGGMRVIQAYLVEMISRRVFVRAVSDFVFRFSRAKKDALTGSKSTELPNYFFDVLTIQKVIATVLLDGLAAVLAILSGLLLLAVYHPVLLAFDIFLIFAVIFLIYVLGNGAITSSIQESKKKHKTAAWLEQILQQNNLYKSHAGQAFAQAQSEVFVHQYLSARKKHFGVVFRQLVGGVLLQIIASAGLLLVGGWLVMRQQLTLGQLVASELVVSVLVASLFKIIKSFEKIYDLMASLDKLGKVIGLELERSGGVHMPPTTGAVEVLVKGVEGHNVRGQNGGPFELRFGAGEVVGLYGLRDVGRSQMGNFLYGLEVPKKGQISIGGNLIQDLRLRDVRRMVSLVRESELIEGTILENIQLEQAHVSHKSARWALGVAGLLPFIQELPQGIHTELASAELSLQQEHQLMLARALASQANVIVLDGTLDFFDEFSLRHFFKAYESESAQLPTLLIFTNHRKTLSLCQRSVELNQSFRSFANAI